jgi:hypothetical protein
MKKKMLVGKTLLLILLIGSTLGLGNVKAASSQSVSKQSVCINILGIVICIL